MPAPTKNEPAEIIVCPEGRLINASLFVMDSYTNPATGKVADPSYKAEVAFNPADVLGEGTIEDKIIAAVEKLWPTDIDDYLDFLEGKACKNRWNATLLDGNRLAADRTALKKDGDAYAGKRVLRAHTQYNHLGQKASGGIAVHGPMLEKIGLVEGNDREIFNGCYGHLAVTFKASVTNDNRYVTAYLKAFQKTRGADTDRLAKGMDTSSLFKPVGTPPAGAVEGRRRRVG